MATEREADSSNTITCYTDPAARGRPRAWPAGAGAQTVQVLPELLPSQWTAVHADQLRRTDSFGAFGSAGSSCWSRAFSCVFR